MCLTGTALKHGARQRDHKLLEGSISLGRGYARFLVMMYVQNVHVASSMERLTISADIHWIIDSTLHLAYS